HLLRNIRRWELPQKTAAPPAESTDLGRHAGEHAIPRPSLVQKRAWQRFDLLPSGLYRRPRHLTGSASPSGEARGLGAVHYYDALPPVGNFTLPRRSMRFSKGGDYAGCEAETPLAIGVSLPSTSKV